MNEILTFINRFKASNPAAMEEAFTRGNCYWFAKILEERFGGIIAYHPVNGHFACLIVDSLYDITGEIDPHRFHSWLFYCGCEPVEADRIRRKCINLEVTP